MRCKNCGTENDDNRYICENCGSPLYDENDFDDLPADNSQNTQSFDRITEQDALDLGITPEVNNDDNIKPTNNKGTEKKSIIVIAILAVVLIAVIASVIVVARTKSAEEKSTTESTSVSTTVSTTKEKTTKETTTKETTTETTTEATTKEESYSIKLISKGGGTVSGAGTYKDGENVTIVATPDDGYQFDGWYSNGSKISNTQKYSFTATENTSISAVFSIVPTTSPTDTTSEDLNGGMD